MKKLSTVALITTLTILSVPMAFSVESSKSANADQRHSSEDRSQRKIEHMQKDIDELQKQLHLKDVQQAAWTQYKSFVTSSINEYAKEKGGRRSQANASQESKSTPERIQFAAARMRDRADKLDKLGKQTESFYQELSPEQKTIFDLHFRRRFEHRSWS